MSDIKVKHLVLVTGDEYENVEINKDIPDWIKENVPEDFINVKSDTFTVLINTAMIVSLEIEEMNKSKLLPIEVAFIKASQKLKEELKTKY